MEGVTGEMVYRCSCRERLFLREEGSYLLKARLVKIDKGGVTVKCRRCGSWNHLPPEIARAIPLP